MIFRNDIKKSVLGQDQIRNVDTLGQLSTVVKEKEKTVFNLLTNVVYKFDVPFPF